MTRYTPIDMAPVGEQLPFWPEQVRSLPSLILRSALFTVSTERDHIKELTQIASLGDMSVLYSGPRLNQTDLDLWEALIHMGKSQPLSQGVAFTGSQMLKALGKDPSSPENHKDLKNGLIRLQQAMLEVRTQTDSSRLNYRYYRGHLVLDALGDQGLDKHAVRLNAHLLNLYALGHSYLDLGQRQALGRNGLAKWLHAFYSTHANPFPLKVETLRNLSGSRATTREFKRMLKTAFDRLKIIGFIESAVIEKGTDLVCVSRVPSAAQRRFLSKRRTAPFTLLKHRPSSLVAAEQAPGA